MYTVRSKIQADVKSKGSKFLGFLFPAQSKAQFEEEHEALVQTYRDATHHCYAWRLNPAQIEEFAQDDGEPGGTAGLPILNRLKSNDLVNVGLIVVRYYGGTNLGTSGLIDAYGSTARHCATQASLIPIRIIEKVRLTYPYSEQATIDELAHRHELQELQATYTADVTRTMACPVSHVPGLKKQLAHVAHRGIAATYLGESYI